MNKKNNPNQSIKDDESFDYELDNSNNQIPNKEYITYPEESVLLDFSLSLSHWELSIEALKQVIKDRDIKKEIKIKKQNKYKKSLIINFVPNRIYCLTGYWIEYVNPGTFTLLFYEKTKRGINKYKDAKQEVDKFIRDINSEYKSIRKEIKDLF